MGRKMNKETREVDARKLRKVLEGTGRTLAEASRDIGRSSGYFSTIINCDPYITAASAKLIEAVLGIKPEEYIKTEEEPKEVPFKLNDDEVSSIMPDWNSFAVPMKVVVRSEGNRNMMFLSDVYDVKSYNGGDNIEMLVYNRSLGFYYCRTEESDGQPHITRATNADVSMFMGVPEGEWVNFAK